MQTSRRIIGSLLLLLALPTLCQPAGGRIVVACIDGSECPDMTGTTLAPAQLARCERVNATACDARGDCPRLGASCADEPSACEEPCAGSATIHFTTPLCAQRCVITTVPARDLPPENHTHVRLIVPALLPLPIANDLLSTIRTAQSSALSRAIEHVPIVVHRVELAPAEGTGARSPPPFQPAV
jgi:hypothetical protein